MSVKILRTNGEFINRIVVNELKDKNEISILDYETFILEATNLMEYFYGLTDMFMDHLGFKKVNRTTSKCGFY